MENQKMEYRSAKRSRQMIRDAYISILQKKRPEKITVTDIVRMADINRSTFYAHYKSPQEVLRQIANDIIEEINLVLKDFNFISIVQDSTSILSKFCNYLKENREMYQKLISLQNVNDFLKNICNLLTNFIHNDPTVPEELKTDENFNIAVSFFVNAIVYSFRDLLAGNLDTSFEQLVAMMNYLISQNFTGMLKHLENLRSVELG